MRDFVTVLDWDTDFFGHKIARANVRQLDNNTYSQLESQCKSEKIQCLYFLADSDHPSTIRLLEDNDFRFVDIRSDFIHSGYIPNIPPLPSNISLRASSSDDLQTLSSIAQDAYSQSRFYVDPNFDNQRVSDMYDIWLSKSINHDLADYVVVAELENTAVGYVTCSIDKSKNTGKIGLVGVAESAQGKKLGTHMVVHAIQWFIQNGIDTIMVTTQGRNIPAQRLYQRCGFITHTQQLWYHKWFTNPIKQ